MNIYRSSEEAVKKALLLTKHDLVVNLGCAILKHCKQVKGSPISSQSSSWTSVSFVRPSIKPVRYYSQNGYFSAPSRQCSDIANPLDSSSQGRPVVPQKPHRNLFFRQLDECRSPSDVLDFIRDQTQTQRRISNSLSRIWGTIKKMSDDQRRYELKLMFEHQGFEDLCQAVILESSKMRPYDMAHCLLALVRLGVPQNSRVIQTLMRVIQENLNYFDERSLSVLAGALELTEPSQNVEALKEGIRLRLDKDMSQISSIVSLQSLMRAVGKDSSDKLKRKFERKALEMATLFTLPNAQYMLSTMAVMGLNSRPLLEICCEKIKENTQGIPFSKLLMVLKACQELHYRNQGLLSSIADYVATTCPMWSTKQVVLLLLEFSKMMFRPVNLMDVFAERVIQDPSALTLKDVLSILKMYSLLNHDCGQNKQQFLYAMTTAVEGYLDKLQPDNLLNVVHGLCIFGHFPRRLMERLLQEDTLNQLIQLATSKEKQTVKGLGEKLQALDVCLRFDQTGLVPPLLSPPVLMTLPIPPHQPPPYGMLLMLRGMEGVERAQEGVLVERLYHIDFEVTVSSPHQDAPSPQKLAVLCVPNSTYCFGSSHLRGKMAMQLRHLQILGYSPVLVSVQELLSLQEEGRLELLTKLLFPQRVEVENEKAAMTSTLEE